MTAKGGTLHFINRVDPSNCGDRIVCPLFYYYDFFGKYNVKRHDIRYIDFESIGSDDVVIVGGGGLFDYAEFINRAINRLLDTGATVIAWSPGLNTHTYYDSTFQTKINFEKFALLTLRDFDNSYGVEYLPDVTCKLPQLKGNYTVKRKFGIARHKDFPIKAFDFEEVTNEDCEKALKFIGETEIVLSNSFHMIYWAMLMGKKTICVDAFSSRFNSYKYKPAYLRSGQDDLDECVKKAQTYDILQECIDANDAFFQKVKNIVLQKLKPREDDNYLLKLQEDATFFRGKWLETQLPEGDGYESGLFVDLGKGFSEQNKLTAVNNVYGEQTNTVYFNISAFPNAKRFRFDPIETVNCEVEIVSCLSKKGEVHPVPCLSIKCGNFDRFLTTDPQYLIEEHCEEFVKIEYRIRKLTKFEAECAISSFVQEVNVGWQKEVDLRNSRIAELQTSVEDFNRQVEQRDSQIADLQIGIENCNRQIADLQKNLECRCRMSEEQSQRILEQQKRIAQQKVALDNLAADKQKLSQEKIDREAQLNAKIAMYRNSKSWKITAPLRGIGKLFRRNKKRGK